MMKIQKSKIKEVSSGYDVIINHGREQRDVCLEFTDGTVWRGEVRLVKNKNDARKLIYHREINIAHKPQKLRGTEHGYVSCTFCGENIDTDNEHECYYETETEDDAIFICPECYIDFCEVTK